MHKTIEVWPHAIHRLDEEPWLFKGFQCTQEKKGPRRGISTESMNWSQQYGSLTVGTIWTMISVVLSCQVLVFPTIPFFEFLQCFWQNNTTVTIPTKTKMCFETCGLAPPHHEWMIRCQLQMALFKKSSQKSWNSSKKPLRTLVAGCNDSTVTVNIVIHLQVAPI